MKIFAKNQIINFDVIVPLDHLVSVGRSALMNWSGFMNGMIPSDLMAQWSH